MARKTVDVLISAEGRDAGKTFRITEMSASQAERWAMRLLSAMARNNVDMPDGIEMQGMAGLASLGLRMLVGVRFHDVEPLLAEMMECVQFVPAPTNPKIPARALIEDDIEEITTRLRLRDEVINLHVGFFVAGELSKLTASPASSIEPSSN